MSQVNYIDILSDIVSCPVKKYSEGAYGELYYYKKDKPYILKVFKKPNMAIAEMNALNELRAIGVNTPEIYGLNSDYSNDILFMEYIDGDNLESLKSCDKSLVGDNVIQQLLIMKSKSYEQCGYFNSPVRYNDWNTFYKGVAENKLLKAENMCKENLLESKYLRMLEKAFSRFDDIFCKDITRSQFIHGDLNPQNIMATKDNKIYFIDPLLSMLGDGEIELFQLNESNGKDYHLFDKFSKTYGLSANYYEKEAFYSSFAETAYYSDVKKKQDSNLLKILDKLKAYI